MLIFNVDIELRKNRLLSVIKENRKFVLNYANRSSQNKKRKLQRKRGRLRDKNVNLITDLDGKKIVLINDIRFKARKREDWKDVEEYLKEYVEEFYEIAETSEKIFISTDFPDEYANSESRMALKSAVAKAKANVAQGIPELIQIATNQ